MKSRKNMTGEFEIIASETFFEILSSKKSEKYYYQNVKRIKISPEQTNYLITTLSWVVQILLNIDGAGRYKNGAYLEIITNDNKSVKKFLPGIEISELKKSIKEIQKNINKK